MNADPTLLQYYVYKYLKKSTGQRQSSPVSENQIQPQKQKILNQIKRLDRRKNESRRTIEQFKFLSKLTRNWISEKKNKNNQYELIQQFNHSKKLINQSSTNIVRKKKNSLPAPLPLSNNNGLQQYKELSTTYFLKAYDQVALLKKKSEFNHQHDKIQSYHSESLRQSYHTHIKLDKNFANFVYENRDKRGGDLGLSIKKMQIQSNFLIKKPSAQQTKRQIIISTTHSTQKPKTQIRKRKRFFDVKTIKNTPKTDSQFKDCIFSEKAKKYREFLFKIYLSNGVVHQFKECSQKFDKKKEIKYEAFVGSGNNSNLIKSLLRKRWWWTISSEMTNQTSFVWTQLKINNIFLKQKQNSFYTPVIKKHGHYIMQNQQSNPQNSEINCLKIMHKIDYQLYKQYLNIFTREPPSLKARMKLINKDPIRQLNATKAVHNHFEFNNFLGNKKALLKNLLNYYSFKNIKTQQYNIPMTFHIVNSKDKQIRKFHSYFKKKQQKNKRQNIWIIKPGENSNRGQGIKISNNLNQINKILESQTCTHIVQQYLCNLFLYNKRKFDIRAYCLITQINGVFKAYWYQQGYIRTSSEQYKLDSLSDIMIHLTNDAIQKYGQNYGKYQPANKISYHDFQKYLDTHYSGHKFSMQKLNLEMKTIAIETINASYFKIDPKCRENNFEIFGLDFIVDKDFKPWLLEVNTNPCLQLSCPLLERIIPGMVENALKIGLDPLFPPTPCPYTSKPYLSDNIGEKNRFQLIFDSQYDRSIQFQNLSSQGTIQIYYQQQDQIYQNQGNEISNID